jgi:AcrR family transcriptional regulator
VTGPAGLTRTGDRPQENAGTRQRLLGAAREVIEQGGYRSASVVSIAERAGVATGTLYRHFASKEDLFVDVFRAVCGHEERAVREAADALGPAAGARERLATVLMTFARRALRNPRLAWALIAEPVDPAVDAERLAYRARYAALIAAHLTAGIKAGQLPPQDVELTAAALVGGCGEALVGPLSRPSDHPADRDALVEGLRTFAIRAIGAP